MKAAFYTLGCKVNQYDTQEMISAMKKAGYEIVDYKEAADIYIINSCTVTAESSRKTRQAVRRFKNEHPFSTVVLTGCFAQAFSKEAYSLQEADIILGNRTNNLLVSELDKFFANRKKQIAIIPHTIKDKYSGEPITSFDGHTRAFMKIQDGCNRYCTYCIIPKARGFSRSRPLEEIKKEVKDLAEKGYKEIVFVGINLSSYGMDTGKNICDALQIAQDTKGIERIRLGSLEPDHITPEVIQRLSNMSKFCPQFHLSLQSGCTKTLKRMNRHYTADEFYNLCNDLKNAFSDISLTTDIIAGFPGETDNDFQETIEFAKKCGFMKVHVFPFSPREGTPAYSYPDKISNSVKAQRCAKLQKECDKLRKEFLDSYIGQSVKVLFETPKDGIQSGYTENYTPVKVKCKDNLSGKILTVKITGTDNDECIGILA